MPLKNTETNNILIVDLSKFNLINPERSRFFAYIYKDEANRAAQGGSFIAPPEHHDIGIILPFWELVIDDAETTIDNVKAEIYRCLALTEEYGEESDWVSTE